jgi:plastocyanin
MCRLRVLLPSLLGVLILVAIAVPLATPALACHCPPFGMPVGFGPWGGTGAWGGTGPFPGVGAYPGFGTYPGFGAYPGFGVPSTFGAPALQPAAAAAERVRLSIRDNFYYPDVISVPVGTQVAWLNEGSNPHTVTFPGVRDSGTIAPGGRWAAIFAVAGTLEYACTIHPEMRGRLIVALQ